MSYTKVEFQPFPELQMAEVAPFFAEVKGLSTPEGLTMQSYGARVVRNCSTEDIDLCCKLLQSNLKRPYHAMKFEHTGTLHEDSPDAFRLTAHLTTVGQAEAIVLVGMRQIVKDPNGWGDKATRQLYRRNRVDTNLSTPPKLAYRGILNTNDILLFDHTEAHAFRSASRERRLSVAYY